MGLYLFWNTILLFYFDELIVFELRIESESGRRRENINELNRKEGKNASAQSYLNANIYECKGYAKIDEKKNEKLNWLSKWLNAFVTRSKHSVFVNESINFSFFISWGFVTNSLRSLNTVWQQSFQYDILCWFFFLFLWQTILFTRLILVLKRDQLRHKPSFW